MRVRARALVQGRRGAREQGRRPWEVPRGARARSSCRSRAGAGIPAGRPAAVSLPRPRHRCRYWSSRRGRKRHIEPCVVRNGVSLL